jgi:beta-glucosidase
MSKLQFPKDFLWGSATAAYQVEGSHNVDGRGPSIWDSFSHTPGKTIRGESGDVACDHYQRWESDLALMQSLGLQAYRFSIAWPRVQPLGQGAYNDKGLAFYDRLVDGLLERGIKPFVTLYHWDLPDALQREHGGWQSRDTAQRFADYAARMATLLGDRVASIASHNEPWCTAYLGNYIGKFAPGLQDLDAMLRVSHHLLLSHGLALQAMRAAGCKAPLGIVLNQSSVTAATNSEADLALAEREYASFVRWYMDPIFLQRYPEVQGWNIAPHVQAGDMQTIAQPLDFLGVNYYTRIWASSAKPPLPAPNALGLTDMGWEIYPQGLTELLTGINRDYKLPPLYITENGMADPSGVERGDVADAKRIDYLHRHLAALHAAIQAGVDLRGYFYWSLLDNYEWDSGYAKRFGIVHVDYATQQRTPKQSALWYRDWIAAQAA